jgi:hypothetical protein
MYCSNVASDSNWSGLPVWASFRGGIKAYAGNEKVVEVQEWQAEKNMNWP